MVGRPDLEALCPGERGAVQAQTTAKLQQGGQRAITTTGQINARIFAVRFCDSAGVLIILNLESQA